MCDLLLEAINFGVVAKDYDLGGLSHFDIYLDGFESRLFRNFFVLIQIKHVGLFSWECFAYMSWCICHWV